MRKSPIFRFIISFIFFKLSLIPTSAISEDAVFTFERLWPVLEQPWYFSSPYDVTADKDGYLYVVNEASCLIQKFTADGHLVTQWGKEGNGDGESVLPHGIAADINGYVYVVDTTRHRIQKFTSDGEFILRWGKEGSGDGEFDRPDDIAADRLGYVYVADTYNHRVQKFTSDGEFVRKWGEKGAGHGEFDYPHGIAVDYNGDNVYVGDTNNQRIQKFTSDGELLTWGSEEEENRTFKHPKVTVDRNGDVYVTLEYAVRKFSSDGTFLNEWGEKGSGSEEFSHPKGIAVDRNGYVYVADWRNQRIQKLTSDGQFMVRWGSGAGEGEFRFPNGIDSDSEGNLYVVDKDNRRIQKFSPDGDFIRQWGGRGEGEGEFIMPQGLAVDTKDRVYVADMGGIRRIQRFDRQGNFEAEWMVGNMEDGSFPSPYGVAADSDDNIYVTDMQNHCVRKFAWDGKLLAEWGNEELFYPKGIAADSDGFVYVADGSHHVIKFDSEGGFLLKWGGECCNDDECYERGKFCFPEGVFVRNDEVYVADSKNGRIQVFDPDGNFTTMWGDIGNAPGLMSYPHDVAISKEGRIYVSDTYNHRIQIFNRITTPANPKAIIIAGGGPFPGNRLWNATQTCANFTYRALTYQGFTKETIHYLTDDTDLDLDNNGRFDDADGPATNSNLEQAITEWAVESSAADSLILYLVDHGGNGTFRMGETETLSAADLGSWLDAVQERISGRIIVIYDACRSGSFLPKIAGPGRIVMTSASPGEEAYFISQGSVSFSNFFWTHIFNGDDLETAFAGASEAVSRITELQNPLIDGDGDGVGSSEANSSDCYSVRRVYIGSGTLIPGQAPVISRVSPDQNITEGNSAGLYAEGVTDDDGIARVWAVIIPPAYRVSLSADPVLEFPSAELVPVQGQEGRYEGRYENFSSEGTYTVSVYARDRNGNISPPKQTKVRVGNPLRHKAVILAGDFFMPQAADHAKLAHRSLNLQGYRADDMYVMSHAPFQTSWYRKPTLGNLEDALGRWAGNARDLVVFLTGKGEENRFYISDTETLGADDLDSLMDAFQQNPAADGTQRMVTVIYDADFSGSFMGPLAGENRILITGASETETALSDSDGAISFSAFFWNEVMNGADLRDVFLGARDALGFFSPDITPQLDDDGNGIPNQISDGLFSVNYVIGAGIIRARNEISAEPGVNAGDFYPDDYEDDDTLAQAAGILIGAADPQHHNFYERGDEDWVRFTGTADEIYTIKADNPGPNCQAILEIYDANGNFFGSKTRVPLDLDKIVWYWKCERDGEYYIKIRNADPELFGEGTGYDLEIYKPSGPNAPGFITGKVTDAISEEGLGEALISTDKGISNVSKPDGEFVLLHIHGSWKVTAALSGYETLTYPVILGRGEVISDVNFRLVPYRHSADYAPQDHQISLSELLRVIQLYNGDAYRCDSGGEDGYAPGEGDKTCPPHDSDYAPQDWRIGLSELLRVIQFYNASGYHADSEGEDGFAPEASSPASRTFPAHRP